MPSSGEHWIYLASKPECHERFWLGVEDICVRFTYGIGRDRELNTLASDYVRWYHDGEIDTEFTRAKMRSMELMLRRECLERGLMSEHFFR